MKEIKLSNNLVPHKDFHKGYWYKSPNLNWYYFKEEKRVNQLPSDNTFIKSVDKALQPLTKFLHSNNIITTPSCSGHIYSEEYFNDVFDKLEKDSYIIKDKGLKVKNIETGEEFLFIDKNYKLPYTKEEFINSAVEYTKKGVIGIYDLNNNTVKALNKIKSKKLYSKTNKNHTLIFTHSETPEEVEILWNMVTYLIKKLYYL